MFMKFLSTSNFFFFFVDSYDDQPPPPQAHQNDALYSRPYPRQPSTNQNRSPHAVMGNDPNHSSSYNQPAAQNLPPPAPHAHPDSRVGLKQGHT